MKKILRVNVPMLEWRVVLGEVIGKVISHTNPMYVKLPLSFTIF